VQSVLLQGRSGGATVALHRDCVVYEIGEDVQVLVLRALNGKIDMQDHHIATLDNKAVFVNGAETGNYGFFETVPSSMNVQVIALNLAHKDPVKREIYQNKDFRIGLSESVWKFLFGKIRG
jgi:peptide/nickel transport system substrate-binding protein